VKALTTIVVSAAVVVTVLLIWFCYVEWDWMYFDSIWYLTPPLLALSCSATVRIALKGWYLFKHKSFAGSMRFSYSTALLLGTGVLYGLTMIFSFFQRGGIIDYQMPDIIWPASGLACLGGAFGGYIISAKVQATRQAKI
jgi:hypothetical protein